MSSKQKILDFIVKYYSFFLYSGYYVGLEIIQFTGNSSLSRIYSLPVRAVFILLLILLLRINKSSHMRRRNNILLFILMFYYFFKVIYTESLPISHLSKNWYEYILYFFMYCYITYLFFSNLDIIKYLPVIIRTILFSGFLLSITTICLYRHYIFSGMGRISMLIYQDSGMEKDEIISPLALAYGAALNLSLLLPYYKLYADKKLITKIYLIVNAILSLIMFSLGSTRGAFLALILSLVYYVMTSKGAKLKYIFLGMVAVPVFLYILEITGSNLLLRTTDAVSKGDTSGRNVLWDAAIEEFVHNPVFGGRIEVSGIYPHDIFLEIAMGMGAVGLILFLALIIGSLIKFSKIRLDRKVFVYICFINAASQYLVTGAFWGAILLFFSLGLMNAKKIIHKGNQHVY